MPKGARCDWALRARMIYPLAVLALLAFALTAPAGADTLLIGNKGENTVSFVDLKTGRECTRLPTGPQPHEIDLSPNGRQAAVVAYGGTTIDIFDVARARLVRRIDLSPGAGPHGIVWLSDGRIAIAAERSRSLEMVDPRSGSVRSIPLGQNGPHMLAVAPDQRMAYVANILSGTVSVVDLGKLKKVGDIPVGGNPEGIAITRDGRQLWVGDDSRPHIRVVNIASQRTVDTLPIDSVAFRVAISPDGRTAVSSNLASGTLNLFDVASRRPLRTIRVSGDAKAMQVTLAFSRDGRRLFVAETMKDTIAEVDLGSGAVLRRIFAGRNGDGLAIAPVDCRTPSQREGQKRP